MSDRWMSERWMVEMKIENSGIEKF